jgi:hypothetical protein
MNWKMARIALVVALTAFLLAAWLLWLRIGPSFSPDDVTLRGKLLPAASVPDAQAANGEAWVAEVQVKRETAAPPSPDGSGGDFVYVYVPGYQAIRYAIAEDNRPGTIRMDGSPDIRQQVRQMLQQIGVAVTESELSDQGFAYLGSLPSYTARVYLKPQTGASGASAGAEGTAYAVYIHQERKLSKNVGWTKAVKLAK